MGETAADQPPPQSAVAVYSGGLDSTVMLYAMREAGVEIRGALSIDYGQKHGKELGQAARICQDMGITHKVADVSGLAELFGASGLTDAETHVPEGHYEEEQMKVTVVPNRNMILIALATAWAISLKADAVAYAAHSGDHAIYPDCREPFARALDQAIRQCDWHALRLYRPFVAMAKSAIVALGSRLGVPFALTWSCYKGGAEHCGRCGTCVERREAFHLAQVEDPTTYASSAPSVDELVKNGWRLID